MCTVKKTVLLILKKKKAESIKSEVKFLKISNEEAYF